MGFQAPKWLGIWGVLVEFGVTQAQTHTFPSEMSRLSRLRKISLYLFLLSGAEGSPWGGEYHTWASGSLPPPTALWQVVWRIGVGRGRGGGGREREREREERERVLFPWGV